LQYTGGTSDLSNGAMLSHGKILANLLQVKEHLNGCLDDSKEIYVVRCRSTTSMPSRRPSRCWWKAFRPPY
jgi:acyl-CoA synthetase (AMP-forming)/AMP-acid ligase II